MSLTSFVLFLIFALAHSQLGEDQLQELSIFGSEEDPNPDAGLNISQFLKKFDYPLEYHDVTTEDGYILTMHRIPFGKNATVEKMMQNKTKPVMFLVHCLACSSVDFVWQGPNASLALELADLGYDVWLANGRGNANSMRHKTLKFTDPEFWDYSFHEKGFYDMPASIDYILNYTGFSKLTYIGHSQGTTQGLVLTSTRPEYNDKINLMVMLSPIVYFDNIKSVPILLFVKYFDPIMNFLNSFNIHGLPYGPWIPFLTQTFCQDGAQTQELCLFIIELIVGFDGQQVDTDKLTVFLANTPNGISVKEVVHFKQEIQSGVFRRFDYGGGHNFLRYGINTPPPYNLSQVTVPLLVYYAKNDYLASTSAVERFLSQLPKEPLEKWLIDYNYFNHLDFVTAKDVKTLLYDRLILALKKYVPVV